MVRISFDISVPVQSAIMDDTFGKNFVNLTTAPGTLQDIAYNIVQDRDRANSAQPNDSGTKERTIFVLGSKGVGK